MSVKNHSVEGLPDDVGDISLRPGLLPVGEPHHEALEVCTHPIPGPGRSFPDAQSSPQPPPENRADEECAPPATERPPAVLGRAQLKGRRHDRRRGLPDVIRQEAPQDYRRRVVEPWQQPVGKDATGCAAPFAEEPPNADLDPLRDLGPALVGPVADELEPTLLPCRGVAEGAEVRAGCVDIRHPSLVFRALPADNLFQFQFGSPIRLLFNLIGRTFFRFDARSARGSSWVGGATPVRNAAWERPSPRFQRRA
jgi:hypothetical protein